MKQAKAKDLAEKKGVYVGLVRMKHNCHKSMCVKRSYKHLHTQQEQDGLVLVLNLSLSSVSETGLIYVIQLKSKLVNLTACPERERQSKL